MEKIEIKGEVKYQNIETGFWSIVDESGKIWRIINMPEKLKINNLKIKSIIKKIDVEFSIFMSGTAAEIKNFTIL